MMKRLRMEINHFKITDAQNILEKAENLIGQLSPRMMDPRFLVSYHATVTTDLVTLKPMVAHIQLDYIRGSGIRCEMGGYVLIQRYGTIEASCNVDDSIMGKLEEVLCDGKEVFD